MRGLPSLLPSIFAVCPATVLLRAQVTAAISGNVLDSSGAGLVRSRPVALDSRANPSPFENGEGTDTVYSLNLRQ
jgi:hypothetical protein